MTRRLAAVAAPALTVALAAGFVATRAAPSYAESISAPDPSGDVRSFDETGHVRKAPDLRVDDAVHTTIDYRRQFLVVRVEARSAANRVQRTVQVLDQDTGRQYSFSHTGPGGAVGGDLCHGMSTTVDKDDATYGVKIPVHCFGAPSLARVAVGLALDTLPDADGRYSADDAQSGGYDSHSGYYAFNRALQRG